MKKSKLSFALVLCFSGGATLAAEVENPQVNQSNSQENVQADVENPQINRKNNSEENFAIDDIVVVSATGFAQNIADAPASISVIRKEDIEKASYQNITDLLKNLGGIRIVSSGSDKNQNISIRGMDSQYTMIMINGKPVSGRETGGVYVSGLNIQTLPPLSMIERIEVIKGPMSSLYGSEAVGGAINIITKKVADKWTANISAQYNIYQANNFKNHYNTEIYFSGPLIQDTLGIELNGLFSHKYEDEKKYNNIEQPLSGDNKNKNIGSKLSWLITKNDTLAFEYQLARHDNLSTESKLGRDFSGKYKKNVFILDHEGKYDYLKIASYLKYDQSKYSSSAKHIPGRDIDTLTFNSQGNYSFNSNILTLGFNYLGEKFDTTDNIKSDRWNIALFGEDDYFVTDNLTLTIGARLNKNESYGTHFSPRLYSVYKITDDFSLKGGVSTGYVNPGLVESAGGTVTSAGRGGSGGIIGNSDLKPESSINYEAGFIYDNNKMNFSLMTFYSDFKDKIGLDTFCSGGDYIWEDRSTWNCEYKGRKYIRMLTYNNLEDLYSTGVELSFDYQILANLKLNSNYTYTKSKYKSGDSKGESTGRFPQHVINLGLNYKPIEKLNLWTQANFKSKEKDNIYSWGTAFGQPSHAVVDFGLVYKVNKHLNLNAGIYNLFDKNPRYVSESDNLNNKSEFLEGRKFMLGLNARF